jgi:hypothetical protein
MPTVIDNDRLTHVLLANGFVNDDTNAAGVACIYRDL